jgi:hypothetical protein
VRPEPPYQPDADGRPCSHCGRILANYRGGYRSVMVAGVLRRLCRDTYNLEPPDCYYLVVHDGRPIGELRR